MSSLSNTGYGIVGKNIIKELVKQNKPVDIFPYGGIQADSQEEFDLLFNAIPTTTKRGFDHNAPCINIWHQHAIGTYVGRGLKVGMPYFELDTFNDLEKSHLEVPDVIATSSQWASDVIQANNISTETTVISPGVNTSIFSPGDNDNLRDNPEQYIFLNVGKWETRKGHDILGKCFNKAFTKEDNVKLVLVPHNPFLSQEEAQNWSRLYTGKVDILPPVETHAEIAGIMQGADCGVFPSRGEGWNLEALEMMACGKSVIATHYSAHTEFCNDRNSSLIAIEETEPAYDGKWFFGDGNWASFDYDQEEQLISHMRHMFNDRPSNQAGVETAKQFSWASTVEKICELCSQVS